MTATIPYTYIQCSCADQPPADGDRGSPTAETSEDDDRTFDPRAPRSNYSLYPLEYLLYCEDCQQIRCPRCVTEETVTYFCPNCLFEVPSSNLRSEGNRYLHLPLPSTARVLNMTSQMHQKLLSVSQLCWPDPSCLRP